MIRRSHRCWFALAWLLATAIPPGAVPPPEATYHPLHATSGGSFPAVEVENLLVAARHAGSGSPILIMIHGFDTGRREGERLYRTVAGWLQAAARQRGLPLVVAGIHWDSAPGSRLKWVPRAFAQRLLATVGFKHAIPDPYEDKIRLARRIGRLGVRALLLHLAEQLPGQRISVLAHSLGCEMLVHALEPQLTGGRDVAAPLADAPNRSVCEPRVYLAVLAGADLDADLLARDRPAQRRLLERADVWWITVPGKGQQDAVLALRRLARGEEALGNSGPRIHRVLAQRLVARGGLYLDIGRIPVSHHMEQYFSALRSRALIQAMAEAADPASGTGPLARIRRLLSLPANAAEIAPALNDADLSVRLYAAWRVQSVLRPGDLLRGGIRWPRSVRDVGRARRLLESISPARAPQAGPS
ncbi:MAG: alpha/beta hydrolase [Armatimonadetes bacterium]|nr:alpha/beta hydrolase [Armatimonadota bacterium]